MPSPTLFLFLVIGNYQSIQFSRLALKIVVMARQEARGKRQEARVKRFWEILLFFTYL
jgi:hypothetical protein